MANLELTVQVPRAALVKIVDVLREFANVLSQRRERLCLPCREILDDEALIAAILQAVERAETAGIAGDPAQKKLAECGIKRRKLVEADGKDVFVEVKEKKEEEEVPATQPSTP